MSKNVLIVEDNEKNLKLIQVILSSFKYRTLTATDGEEGVRLARENLPDLVLMDVQMPKMDGVTAMKALQADKRTAHIPVIALTSYAMKGDRERLLDFGFFDYIAKPIQKNAFMEIVERALKQALAK